MVFNSRFARRAAGERSGCAALARSVTLLNVIESLLHVRSKERPSAPASAPTAALGAGSEKPGELSFIACCTVAPHRNPTWRSFLKLIVGQLTDIRAVGAHHINIAVGLDVVRMQRRFVLESLPFT